MIAFMPTTSFRVGTSRVTVCRSARAASASRHGSPVLLDWSCRESLHVLDYLNNQTVPRDQYEIIWIEYYQHHSKELRRRLAAARASGQHPPVDVHAILGMPRTVYYHKHLMYNLG